MDFIHHPFFQSLVLPALLAGVGMVALRTVAGPGWAAWGATLGLLTALAVLPGFGWPVAARADKLPWIVLAAAVLAALCLAGSQAGTRAERWCPWWAGVAAWSAALLWLFGTDGEIGRLVAAGLAGAVVLGLLLVAPTAAPRCAPDASVSAALVVASLGLAASAGLGGSLLLAQLALMVATTTAVPGLWTWLRPRGGAGVAPAALLPPGLAWLALSASLPEAGPVVPALLALAFVVPAALVHTAWAGRHARWCPLASALLAAVPVALALAWQLSGPGSGLPGAVEAPRGADPYYTPAWR